MEISIIVPVYNECDNLQPLFERLKSTLDKLDTSYELIFVNDGSTDASLNMLKEFYTTHREVVKIIDLSTNSGQHQAILAGFANASGNLLVTIDADLQNPPEEIENIVAKFKKGFDYIGTVRKTRNDSAFRIYASKLMNKIRKVLTHTPITDQGCMLRGYAKSIAKKIINEATNNAFIPILGYNYASNPTEIDVCHSARNAGKSKYNVFSLIKLSTNLFKKQKSEQSIKRKYTIKEKIGF